MLTQMFILEPTNVELAASNRFKQGLIFLIKEVESGVTALVINNRLRDFVQMFDPRTAIIESGNELQVPLVGSGQDLTQRSEAVNASFHLRPCEIPLFTAALLAAMFYLTVVLEKGNVIGRRLDPQNQAELVVHLDGYRTHVMLDAGSLDPRVEVVAHLVLVIPSQLSAKKGRDVLRLHRVNRGSCQGLVNLLQIALPGKNDICRVLRLHEAPMILHVEMLNDGAEVLSKLVQGPMQSLNIQFGRQSLGLFPVGDRAKGIVD